MFTLARINNKRYSQLFKAVITLVVIISVIFLVVSTIGQGSKKIISNLSNQKVSLREIEITSYSEEGYSEVDSNTIEQISKISHVSTISVKYKAQLKDSFFIIDSYKIPINKFIGGVNTNFETFSELDKNLIMEKEEKYLVAGQDFSGVNSFELLIDQNLVCVLGYENVEDIIGKNISLSNENSENSINFKVIGVFNYGLGSYSFCKPEEIDKSFIEMVFRVGYMYPFIVPHAAFRDIISAQPMTDIFLEKINVDVDVVSNVASVYEDVKNLTSNYINSEVGNATINAKRFSMMQQIINTIIFIALFANFLILINSIVIKMEKQKSFIKMLHTLGYNKKQLAILYILDFTWIFLISLIIYTFIAFGLSIIIEAVLKNFYVLIVNNISNVFFLSFKSYVIYSASLFVMYELITFILIMVYTLKINRGLNYENKRK